MGLQMALLLTVMAVTLLFWRVDDGWTNRRICISIVTIILTCFSGFRSWWMGDCIKYYTQYLTTNREGIINSISNSYQNSGIRIFFLAAGKLGMSFGVCIFLIAAFVAITLGILIFKYSPAPYWSYLTFISMGFYLFTYSGLKQAIAMGFIVLAGMQIFENHPVRFIFWVIIAGLFHAPAFIFLIAYPIAKKKMDRYFIAMLLISFIFLFFFRDNLVLWSTDVYYDEDKEFIARGMIGGKAMVIAILLVGSAYLRPPRAGDNTYCQVYNLIIISAILQSFSVYNNVFTRLSNYYFQFAVLFVPLMLETGEHQLFVNPEPAYVVRYYNRELYVLAGMLATIVLVWYYYMLVSYGAVFVDDYKFFWQQDAYALYGQ